MKLATILHNQETVPVLVSKDEKSVLPLMLGEVKFNGSITEFPGTLLDCIKEGSSFLGKAKQLSEWAESSEEAKALWIPLEEVKLLSPIPRPAKNVFCVGKNYEEHAIEMGGKEAIPEHIMIFTKAPTTVIGHEATIPSHSEITDQLDYEGELAFIIGKEGNGISKEDALDYVFGYTIVNDISARDIQYRHKQFFLGKSLDGTCPIGPWIVTKDEIDNPNKLNLQTRVNGELRQDSNTENFIFPIEQIIEELSKGMTLEPGDIIATGTPAGVGKGFNPPKLLRAGDKVEVTVEKIGVLKNIIAD